MTARRDLRRSRNLKTGAMPMRRRAPGGAYQRGVVLVVALIFLLLLTILAISASGRSLLQQRMAGGLLNAQRAEMSAQTALRGAEWRLWSAAANVAGGLGCNTSLFPGCYDSRPPATPPTNVVNFRTKPGWVTAGSVEYLGLAGDVDFTATVHGKLAENPRYIVEDLGPVVPPGTGPQKESGATGSGSGVSGQPSFEMYRITARATGGDPNTVRVLESTFDALQP